jgi:hypothetical protein
MRALLGGEGGVICLEEIEVVSEDGEDVGLPVHSGILAAYPAE